MEPISHLISILRQQRNQALDVLADVASQLDMTKEQLAEAQAEIEQLRAEEVNVAATPTPLPRRHR